jgi:hypothetical protein
MARDRIDTTTRLPERLELLENFDGALGARRYTPLRRRDLALVEKKGCHGAIAIVVEREEIRLHAVAHRVPLALSSVNA